MILRSLCYDWGIKKYILKSRDKIIIKYSKRI